MKSQAQESDVESEDEETESGICYTPNQIHKLNLFRIQCKKDKADLTTTVQAYQKEREQNSSPDHSVTVLAVIGTALLTAFVCSQVKC